MIGGNCATVYILQESLEGNFKFNLRAGQRGAVRNRADQAERPAYEPVVVVTARCRDHGHGETGRHPASESHGLP